MAMAFRLCVAFLLLYGGASQDCYPHLYLNTAETNQITLFPTAIVAFTGTVNHATVTIDTGFRPADDSLSCTPVGAITCKYNQVNGELIFSGVGTAAEYQKAIRSVLYKYVYNVPVTKDFSFAVGNAEYSSLTGHFYEYVPIASGITWAAAKSAAGSRTFHGLTGYLATILSDAENKFIAQEVIEPPTVVALGGSDAAQNGIWAWTAGPEALENAGQGRRFWQHNATHIGCLSGYYGVPLDSHFHKWAALEPSDCQQQENYLGMDQAYTWDPVLGCRNNFTGQVAQSLLCASPQGIWGDYPSDYKFTGYVVEYGTDTTALPHDFYGCVQLSVFTAQGCSAGATCNYNGACDASGLCICNAGFKGTACNQCAPSYEGFPSCKRCVAAPQCSNHGCILNYACTCFEGWQGANCTTCAPGYYGPACSKCPDCNGRGTCNSGVNGAETCSCAPGFDPHTFCTDCLKVDPDDFYGPTCSKQCPDCDHGYCDAGITGSGSCICIGNYTSESHCSECYPGHFGLTCQPCGCNGHGVCADGKPGNGTCTCSGGLGLENELFHLQSGQSVSTAGNLHDVQILYNVGFELETLLFPTDKDWSYSGPCNPSDN
eukprot:TRINITY_DN274_c0_g1_i2.p1 TRINITY_DN274_c0_g1~~TRINITY_DN274_c0_g1_i2.p1  ORF type:complete len:602 (-),score=31.06 TRINITY_DN274_c0_g1_i2:1370-3175(-)